MPLYDLYCDCGWKKEQMMKLNQAEPKCDKCGLRMKKAMSAPAFVLKGNSWASDNYGLSKTTKKSGDKKNGK